MAEHPSKRVKADGKKLMFIADPVGFCGNSTADMYRNIYFFNMHFDEWNPDAPLSEPRVFEPGKSVCRQYFEEVFPGNAFKNKDVEKNIRGSAELIDMFHGVSSDLYFFKARPAGFRGIGRDENAFIMSTFHPQVAVAVRPVSRAFKNAGQGIILNRLDLTYPVTYRSTPEQTEAVAQGLNHTITPLINKYKLVGELVLNVGTDMQLFAERLDAWPEMHQLFNLTHSLTFHEVVYSPESSLLIDSILRLHPRLRIVIQWLVVVRGSYMEQPIVDPNRVYVQNLVYTGHFDDYFDDTLMTGIVSFSNHVARVMPVMEYRNGELYKLSFETGRYTRDGVH
jgi:hypothetical protein